MSKLRNCEKNLQKKTKLNSFSLFLIFGFYIVAVQQSERLLQTSRRLFAEFKGGFQRRPFYLCRKFYAFASFLRLPETSS